jgi:hypothetical protein
MWVQVGEGRIGAVTLESFPRAPLDEDQHLAGLDVAADIFAKAPQRHHSAPMPFHFLHGSSRVCEVLVAIRDVE